VAAYESRANTILHEMAHMWFGDLVTMRWWDDLWLNESFAEWAAHDSSERRPGTPARGPVHQQPQELGLQQDQQPSTHPIAADNEDLEAVEVNFDGITYARAPARCGSSWRGWVRRSSSRPAGVLPAARVGQHRSRRSAAGRWRRRPVASSGSWSKEWLETAGVNTLRPVFEVDAEGRYTSFAVEQTAAAAFPTLRRPPDRDRPVRTVDAAGERRMQRRHRLELDIEGARTEVPELSASLSPTCFCSTTTT
jgi:aminopeptidase N